MSRVKIFVDFWNLQLAWNDMVGKDSKGKPIRIPWETQFPKVIVEAISKKRGEKLSYAGTHVYASYDSTGDSGLKNFLNIMDSFPGYSIFSKARKSRRLTFRCNLCKKEVSQCPHCNQHMRRTVEKGIDSAILTDMIQMAHDDVYDIAVICSADADLAGAIKFIQERIGKQVYNVWFPGGVDLRNACWDHLPAHDLLSDWGIGEGGSL